MSNEETSISARALHATYLEEARRGLAKAEAVELYHEMMRQADAYTDALVAGGSAEDCEAAYVAAAA